MSTTEARRTGVAFGNSDSRRYRRSSSRQVVVVLVKSRNVSASARRWPRSAPTKTRTTRRAKADARIAAASYFCRLAQRTISGETAKTGASATIPAWWPVTASGTRTAMPASGAPLPRSWADGAGEHADREESSEGLRAQRHPQAKAPTRNAAASAHSTVPLPPLGRRLTIQRESSHVATRARSAGTRRTTNALEFCATQCCTHSSRYPFGRLAPSVSK